MYTVPQAFICTKSRWLILPMCLRKMFEDPKTYPALKKVECMTIGFTFINTVYFVLTRESEYRLN